MKKQLLVIVSIVFLALFANITQVQATGCVSNSGFTPSAGVAYTYVTTIQNVNGYSGGGHFYWYVTQDPNLLETTSILNPGPAEFFIVNTGAGLSEYNIPFLGTGATTNSLGLTWSETANGQTFYLVLRYKEANVNAGDPGCEAQNIRVWKIQPNVATNFVLAISGSNTVGDSIADASQCAGIVDSAVINTLLNKVKVIYAPNTLYFLVKASGANSTWTPAIELPSILANSLYEQTYGSAQWASLPGLTSWYDFNGVAGTSGGVYNSTQTAPVTDAGSYILVKVQVNNRMFETLADQGFLVGVDGQLASGQKDIWGPGTWPNNPDPCDEATDFAKKATYTILARPNVTPVTGTFITQLPN